MLYPFPSFLSSLLTRSKLDSSVKGSTLQVTGYWDCVWVQGQEVRGHRPVQEFLSGNWKKVWSSISHYPCVLKKDFISSQTPTSKETGCFFWKLPVQSWGCSPAGTGSCLQELLVREEGVHHRRRSLQGIVPLRDFGVATAVLGSPREFSGVWMWRDLHLPFHTAYFSGFSTFLKITNNMGDSLHAHLEPFSGSAQ